MREGYTQVYTGNGKGKTTAAIGLAVRALGAGLAVYIGQFIKGMRYSEIGALELLAEAVSGSGAGSGAGTGAERRARLDIRQYGRGCFIGREPEQADRDAARAGLDEARAALLSGRYDVVILDEANVAVSLGLIAEGELLALMAARPSGAELVVTGRYATEAVLDAADLVTEMREVRHYYARGVQAREGIER